MKKILCFVAIMACLCLKANAQSLNYQNYTGCDVDITTNNGTVTAYAYTSDGMMYDDPPFLPFSSVECLFQGNNTPLTFTITSWPYDDEQNTTAPGCTADPTGRVRVNTGDGNNINIEITN